MRLLDYSQDYDNPGQLTTLLEYEDMDQAEGGVAVLKMKLVKIGQGEISDNPDDDNSNISLPEKRRRIDSETKMEIK